MQWGSASEFLQWEAMASMSGPRFSLRLCAWHGKCWPCGDDGRRRAEQRAALLGGTDETAA